MKLIGKGAFTKAYLKEDGKVYLISSDPIKECMAHGWFPDSKLFPKIGLSEDGEGYIMEYYPRVSSLKKNLDEDQYKIYKDLRGIYANRRMPGNSYDNYSKLYKDISELNNIEVRDVLLEALDACANYGSDIGFEISPRNVSCKNGKLVLMDCFYSISKLREVRGCK